MVTETHGATAEVSYPSASGNLRFMSAPLAEKTEITGPLALTLYVSSSTEDADLFVTLQAFSPDEKKLYVIESQPGKRAMVKVKHVRTAECVVGGFRWHKSGKDAVGSLLLGLYDDEGVLHHVGVAASFTMEMRKQLAAELEPLRTSLEGHPWRGREVGSQSRWSAGKDLSWQPLRIERVCEVKYDHLQGERFRHATQFVRWRPDKPPVECRYDQLEVTSPYELEKVLGASRRKA